VASDLDEIIGTRLRYYRLAKNLSLADLSNCLDVSYQQIQKYENGEDRVSVYYLVQFAKLLGFTMEEFFHGIAKSKTSDATEAGDMDRVPPHRSSG